MIHLQMKEPNHLLFKVSSPLLNLNEGDLKLIQTRLKKFLLLMAQVPHRLLFEDLECLDDMRCGLKVELLIRVREDPKVNQRRGLQR